MICKKLTKKIFLDNNSLVLKLPELNAKSLFVFLKKKGYLNEAKIFYRENICGKDFISMLSNQQGLPILFDDFHFSEFVVEQLKELYLFIFKYRRSALRDSLYSERPFYWF